MPEKKTHYAKVLEEIKEIERLESISALLHWDMETYLPSGSLEIRAEQLVLLSRLIHARQTDERLWEWVLAAEQESLDENGKANVREIKLDFERSQKIPARLVSELSNATSFAHEAWKAARKTNDFAAFQPHLEKILKLKRESARCLATKDQMEYDALLDNFEPEMSLKQIQPLFKKLKQELIPLIRTIREKQKGE